MTSLASLYPVTHDTDLDVVNDVDAVIGVARRSVIHDQGLYHREVHVWFITPAREVIFQKRSAHKDTFPGLLDATVGGHVELGDGYDQSAQKEMLEETGLNVDAAAIIPLGKMKSEMADPVTKRFNNCHRMVYGHVFHGALSDLVIEDGQGVGFVALPLTDILSGTSPLHDQIIPALLQPEYIGFYVALGKLTP